MNNRNIWSRSIKYLVWISVCIVRKIFPPFDIFCIKYLAKKNGNKIVRLEPKPIKEYCVESRGKVTIVEEGQNRGVYEPAYYLKSNDKEYLVESQEIYIAEMTDVTVHGGTGIIITENYALTDIVANDVDNRVKYEAGAIRRGRKKTFYIEMDKNVESIERAISLCGLASSNYYHLTFEILSRYEYVKKILGENDVWVLLGEDARKYPQYEELINCVLKGVHIKYIPQYKGIRCKKLIYPSMNTWMPMNVMRKYDFRISDNCIAESAVSNIRKATKDIRIDIADKDNKIFISRKNSQLSRVVNEKEVAALFERKGYKIVCTEDFGYEEQVRLFSSASCIVGASGAALTNLVYCNKGTVFGCIIPQKYKFCIYSSIAHMVGCKCLYLDAKVTKMGTAISTEQYMVDLDQCYGYIDELERMIG